MEGGDGGVGRERERSAERLGSPLGAPVCGSGVAMCRCARVSLCLWDGVHGAGTVGRVLQGGVLRTRMCSTLVDVDAL